MKSTDNDLRNDPKLLVKPGEKVDLKNYDTSYHHFSNRKMTHRKCLRRMSID